MKNLKSFLFITTLLTVQMINFPTYAQQKDSVIPSQKEALSLMQGICGEGNVTEENGKVSCQTCPSYTGSATSGGSGGSLTSVVYGSFTKPGIREALVDFSGCQPHSHNYGGSVLLRQNNNGWYRVRYEKGFRSNNCLKLLTKKSINSLVCEESNMFSGYLMQGLNSIEIGTTKTTNTNLLFVGANIGSCRPPYYEILVKDFKLRNINQNKQANLIVTVSEARSKNNQKTECGEANLGKAKIHQLTFLFNGQNFYPTKATAKIIRNFPK